MNSAIRPMAFVACGLLSTLSARAAAPFSFDAAPGRLPKNVMPTDYTIAVTPHMKELTISGTESIALQVRSATATVQFNSIHQKLRKVMFDGIPVKSVVSDDDKQLTTITLSAPASIGSHTLTFAYSGKIEQTARGMFAQDYADTKGVKGVLLTTQFESTDARRMFPCWDEPAFRATFTLSATVPASWSTVGNMPIKSRVVKGDLATVTFDRSPKMPSYLVEFTGGDIASISSEVEGFKFAVWAVKGHEQEGQYALANAKLILADYNEYFGYRFPLPKLDSIAVPGGFSGAMENWGAITYNDQILLVTPASALGDRQQVFAVQAHEMAHQWNGDLVTMGWWDDIWLNESFASWMAAKETALRNPDWKWWENQDADKERAMDADGRSTSHSIEQHVTDELQADNAFDPVITYSKGQAILRMLEAYLGPDVFRSGIRLYMQAHAFSNATSADLWNGLSQASGKDMAAIASGWTTQAGFPLVFVSASCVAGARTISLSQKRFLMGGSDATAPQWNVPLQVRIGESAAPQSVLLTKDAQTLSAGRCDEPLSVDANAIGYYRVSYDAATLATNSHNFAHLPDADRIALLDDQWALVESGAAQLDSYLAMASAMGTDMDTRAWEQIVHALGRLERYERGSAGYDAYVRYAMSVLKPALDHLGWDTKPNEAADVKELRQTLIGSLGEWGDPAVVAEARKRFAAYVSDHSAIAPDYQQAILSVVARHADAATFEQLHQIAKASADQTELQRYYGALMDVGDPALARQAAEIALSNEIPPQSEVVRVGLVAELANRYQQLAWTTFTQNSQKLLAPMTTFAPLVVAQQLPQVFWSGIPLTELETWVRAHVPAEMSPQVERGLEAARLRIAQKSALTSEADAYVRKL